MSRKKLGLLAVTLLGGTVLSGGAQAALFSVGDVFASTGGGKVTVYNPDGTLLTTLDTGGGGITTGSTTDTAGNFYVTNFSTSSIYKFSTSGTNLGVWATDDPGSHNESIIFGKNGNAFIGQPDGTRHIIQRDATGGLVASYTVTTGPRGTDWVDLNADQHTIYYTSEGSSIRRLDTSTSTQLSDFVDGLPGSSAYALRILTNGDVLVADSSAALLLDPTGTVLKTYTDPGVLGGSIFALNVDSDGKSFWTGDYSTGNLVKFDIASGSVLETIMTGSHQLYGVSVYGELTSGGGGVGGGGGGGGGTSMPEPASLALLGAGFAGLGLVRRRRSAPGG